MASKYHPEMTAQLLNIHYEKQMQTCSGALNGYPVFLKWYPGDLTYAVRIFAKHPQEQRCQEQLAAFRQMHPGFHFLYLRAGILSATYILQNGEAEAQIANEISALAALAAQLGLLPCCADCGETSQHLEIYRTAATEGVCLCPRCSELCRLDTQSANAAVQAHRPSGGGTAIGILIMAAYLFLMLFVLGAAQIGSGLGTVVQVIIATLLGIVTVHRFGGTATRRTAAICIIVCAVCSVGFITLRQAVDLTKFNQKNLEQFRRIEQYFEVVDRGDNPYEVFADDKEMNDLTWSFAEYTPEKLEASRNRAAFACQYHKLGSVLMHLPEGMRKVYNKSDRRDFWYSLILAAGCSLWIGIAWWKLILRRKRESYQFAALPTPGRIAQTISEQT